MGTRADFYVGRGASAEWLGSVAWDGHPETRLPELDGSSEEAYRTSVEAILTKERHATRPADGWPWPWEDSRTTDYAYAYDADGVWTACFGYRWMDQAEAMGPPTDDEDERAGKQCDFPDMTSRQNVTWGERSGIIIVRVTK
jgi:hypothetical protein